MQKQAALNQIVEIAHRYNLSHQDITAALTEKNEPKAGLLQTVITYLGAVFIFGGICTYVSIVWDDLDSLARVIISLGSGFTAFILGLMAHRDEKFTRAATPIFIIAAILQTVGLFTFLHEYMPPSGDMAAAACFVFGIMAVQQSFAFFAFKKTSLLFFSLFFFYAFLSAAMDKAGIQAPVSIFTLGLSGLIVSYRLNQSAHQSVTPFYFFIGGLAIAAASYDFVKDTPFDVLLIGIIAVLTMVSVKAQSRTLLAVSIISLLSYLIYFTDEYFKNFVSWPIALIIIGMIMIAASSYAFKLGRKMKTA